MAERIGYRSLATKGIVGVDRLVAERVDGLGNAALLVVDDLRRIAASVGLRDLAAEGVVGVGGSYAGGGAGGDGQATAGDSLGRERRGRGGGRLGRRVGGTVEVGAGDGGVAERVEGMDLGNKETLRRGRSPRPTIMSRQTGTGDADAGQGGGAVLPRLPGRTFAPPVTVERNVPRVVRDDAVRVVPVNLAVEVHVGVGQAPLTKGIIAKIGVGQRCRCRIFVQHVSARGDELVRSVVLVGGNQQSAAEAGAGLADGAADGVFVGAAPARRG